MQVETQATTEVRWPIRHIAVAFDDTAEGKRALDYTTDLAKATGAEVTVLHFRETSLTRYGGPATVEPTDEVVTTVRKAARQLTDAGVVVSATVDDSPPVGEAKPIAEAAEKFGADLIVVGSRGLSTGRAWIQGSVAHDLIHATKLPVLIVR